MTDKLKYGPMSDHDSCNRKLAMNVTPYHRLLVPLCLPVRVLEVIVQATELLCSVTTFLSLGFVFGLIVVAVNLTLVLRLVTVRLS